VIPDQYQAVWRGLRTPSLANQLEASEVDPGSGVWVARDASDLQHLLVQVPDGSELDVSGTHGLGVSISRHRIPEHEDATYIDLVCLDQAVAPTFAAVAADIAEEALHAEPASRLTEVVAALNEWRWFWGVDPTRLSATDAIGLFGELWFLIRWAGASPASIQAWGASDGSRHDFQWPQYSVEVKATSRAGAAIHSVQNLEQLEDPESGDLYLFSLRLARDALAANTLSSLVSMATAALGPDAESRAELLTKLGQRGYTPAGRDQSAVPYRVIEEALYRVAVGFPRLTRSSFPDGLPAGVSRVSYQLDMTACQDWLFDRSPDSWPPRCGPKSL
jgi:Putative  PD-(D/E)XK family member, (DUF4420)